MLLNMCSFRQFLGSHPVARKQSCLKTKHKIMDKFDSSQGQCPYRIQDLLYLQLVY